MLAATLDSIPIERPEPSEQCPQGLWLDRGYDYDSARELATERGFTLHIRARGEEVKLKLRTSAGAPAAGSARHATPGSTATGRS